VNQNVLSMQFLEVDHMRRFENEIVDALPDLGYGVPQ
jgi:hypothetical protein